MLDNLITEYTEEIVKDAQDISVLQPQSIYDRMEPETLMVTFEEEEPPEEFIEEPEFQVLEVGDEIGDVTEYEEPNSLPGAENYVEDEEVEEEEKEEGEPDWENDRNPEGFMSYILRMYPGSIPSHDGRSISGCERALRFIEKLNREISEAIRNDARDQLDVDTLEGMRVNMIKDVVKLKNQMKKLHRKHRDTVAEDEQDSLIKEATTPKIQLVMTPFERAVTGIMINSTISAGRPIEDVYQFLKDKYKFTPREELAILQLAMDMGYHIFKDRGTIGSTPSDGSNDQGVDFIRNYFS